ncbi:hypothetical protein D9M71_313680 [compost metagenome]
MPQAGTEAQRHQHDARWVDGGQHRHREGDQLGQAEVRHQQRETGEDDHQAAVGQRHDAAEVFRTGAGQADRGDQAGQGDQHGEEAAAQRAEGVLHVGMQNGGAVAGAGGDVVAAGTQAEQADVHQGQPYPGDQAGDDGVAGDQPRRLHATGADGIDDDDAEHQRAEGIHGQVAIDEALGERGVLVGRFRVTDGAGRQDEGSDAQRGERDDLQRREEASDGIQQLARIQGNQQHDQEVDQAVDEQRHGAMPGQRRQADFEGHGGGTRGGEQRADRQVADCGEQTAGDPADRMAEGVHRPADLRQRDHGDHRQTHGGNQEAQSRHPHVRPGLQTDDGRKDDVACPDEQGKSHEAKRQDILAFESVHLREIPQC